jgi:hypothetical protein
LEPMRPIEEQQLIEIDGGLKKAWKGMRIKDGDVMYASVSRHN